MAREAVARTRRNIMAQDKTPRHLGKAGLHANITQSQSLLNVSELETRAKATVKDINELYAALQGLVPKKSPQNRRLATSQRRNNHVAVSGTDTDTARSSDDRNRPLLRRRYNSEKLPRRTWLDTNMNYVTEEKITEEKTGNEKPVLEKTLSNERLFASDTEAELHNADASREQHSLQRHFSLPAYDEESANETWNETDESHKRSRFLIFRRRRKTKSGKKKGSSWRSFFSTLSLKRRKSKKHGKNKIAQANAKTAQIETAQTPRKQQAKKNVSLPLDERTPRTHTPRQSFDAVDNKIRQSARKRIAPEPPLCLTPEETPPVDGRDRKNTMETESDVVQKKINAWYKHVVKETNSLVPSKETVRATRSCEDLLTDTELLRKRGTFSSDTDSMISGGDKNRVNKPPKTRVRKTRARRNRRREEERARFHSCPNVKLVTKALDEAEKKTNSSKIQAECNETTKDELTDGTPQTTHVTTIKSVEAQLSFGSTLEKEEPVTDFAKLQKDTNARNWLTRQCSKTTISCIRPLQLNLFYSESPSREAVHRSRITLHRPPRIEGQEARGNPHEFAFKIRRSSSRRRKRRSFKRGQTRLPHQSPFYVPPSNLNLTPKDKTEDCSLSKDSGLGSPDSLHDRRFATFPVMKRDQRLSKLHSESEDSGWASRDRRFASKADTAIQTDPVIVMTAVSKVRLPVLPHVIKEDNDQSEA